MSKMLNCPKITQNIPRLGNNFSAWLGRTVLSAYGWSFSGEFPDHKKMVVAVAPHTSNWDFVFGLAVVFCLKLKISFFGKHSIFIPPFDRLLKRWGGIPIERSQAHGVVGQMITQIQKADKMLLCIAPEGTRSVIYPWKTGFLHIAHKAEVPVLLIGLDYKNRCIQLGPLLEPSDNIELEMQKVYAFYAKVQPKFPSKVAFPAENTIEK